MGATNANNSTFLGYEAGTGPAQGLVTDLEGQDTVGAVGASNSLLIGYQAGYNESSDPDFLTEASAPLPMGIGGNVVFVGNQAGYGANGAVGSTFVGINAGYGAVDSMLSTFIGGGAGFGAVGSLGSVFMGVNAGYEALNAMGAVFLGNEAGSNLQNQPGTKASVFLGNNTGSGGVNIEDGVFLGNSAGFGSDDINHAVLIGNSAGQDTSRFNDIVAVGTGAASEATDANYSIFLGGAAGSFSHNANGAIFIGYGAGGYNDSINNNKTSITYTCISGCPFDAGDVVIGGTSGEQLGILSDDGVTMEFTSASGKYEVGETITGFYSGATAIVDTSTPGETSIAIGDGAKTGGYSNSIALGSRARNTAEHQFMIGSHTSPIDEIRVEQTGGNQCIIDLTGLGCTSDERLKTNITDLSNNIIDTLNQVRTVTYNWKADPDGKQMIGFLAQDLENYFPQLVNTNEVGQKSVNYANITPVLLEAIRELDLKIENIENAATAMNQTGLIAWFADVANGIGDFFTKTSHTETLCVGTPGDETCINKSQLDIIISNGVSGGYGYGSGN
jgi:hypothetical protein